MFYVQINFTRPDTSVDFFTPELMEIAEYIFRKKVESGLVKAVWLGMTEDGLTFVRAFGFDSAADAYALNAIMEAEPKSQEAYVAFNSYMAEKGIISHNFGGDDSTREHPVDPALAVDTTKPFSELYAEIKVIPNFAR